MERAQVAMNNALGYVQQDTIAQKELRDLVLVLVLVLALDLYLYL